MTISGVWAVDDEVTVSAPPLATIADMLRTSVARGDLIELQSTALKAAKWLEPQTIVLNCTSTRFRDEIGC